MLDSEITKDEIYVNYQAKSIKAILLFIYTGYLTEITQYNILEILLIAEEWQLEDDLVPTLRLKLRKILNEKNVMEFYEKLYSYEALSTIVEEYIKTNFQKLIFSIYKLPIDPVVKLLKDMQSNQEPDFDEMSIHKAVVDWCVSNEGIRGNLSELLDIVEGNHADDTKRKIFSLIPNESVLQPRASAHSLSSTLISDFSNDELIAVTKDKKLTFLLKSTKEECRCPSFFDSWTSITSFRCFMSFVGTDKKDIGSSNVMIFHTISKRLVEGPTLMNSLKATGLTYTEGNYRH